MLHNTSAIVTDLRLGFRKLPRTFTFLIISSYLVTVSWKLQKAGNHKVGNGHVNRQHSGHYDSRDQLDLCRAFVNNEHNWTQQP